MPAAEPVAHPASAAWPWTTSPWRYEEFLRAALKARPYFALLGGGAGPASAPAAPEENHIYLKAAYQLVRVALADIMYAEGLKDYGKVHLASAPRPLLSLTSLRGLEEKLPARRFLRIHRSYQCGPGPRAGRRARHGTAARRNPTRERALPRSLRPALQPLALNPDSLGPLAASWPRGSKKRGALARGSCSPFW